MTTRNLNHFRKQKNKIQKEKTAEKNRIMHGRTKSEKKRDTMHKNKDENTLNNHRLDK